MIGKRIFTITFNIKRHNKRIPRMYYIEAQNIRDARRIFNEYWQNKGMTEKPTHIIIKETIYYDSEKAYLIKE